MFDFFPVWKKTWSKKGKTELTSVFNTNKNNDGDGDGDGDDDDNDDHDNMHQ